MGLLFLALAAFGPSYSRAQEKDAFGQFDQEEIFGQGFSRERAADATPGAPSADAPALVLDPDPTVEKIGPDPLEAGPGAGEADLSAPGMTGSSSGTIPIMLVEAAYLAHRKGEFKEAIEGYTRIIRRRGLTKRERAVSYLLRGEAKRDDGQLDEAVLDFTRALRQWPGYPSAHYFRGRIYEGRNQLNDAYADLAMAAYLDPTREAYQTSLSVLKLRLREAGLLSDGPPPRPIEPRLPEE
jgi:tetratricopeptide (TPR) repeat protein